MMSFEDLRQEVAVERDLVIRLLNIRDQLLRLAYEIEEKGIPPEDYERFMTVLVGTDVALTGLRRVADKARPPSSAVLSPQAPFGDPFRQRVQNWRDEMAMREGR